LIAKCVKLYPTDNMLCCIVQLALSAASPIYRGFLADTDCRWNVISASVDDRTREERGIDVSVVLLSFLLLFCRFLFEFRWDSMSHRKCRNGVWQKLFQCCSKHHMLLSGTSVALNIGMHNIKGGILIRNHVYVHQTI